MKDLTSDPIETDQHAPAMSEATCDCAETMHDHNEAEVWDDDKTGFKHKLKLRADSFNPKRLFDIAPSHDWFSGILSPSRNYVYSNRILPAGQRLKLALRPLQEGTVEFDRDVVIPTVFDLTKASPEPWMSLTPNLMINQRPAIQHASGTVMVGHLGLGWFLRKVHDKPNVKRIIVVERCQELLDWYGYDLCQQLPKVKVVICDDVCDQIGRFGSKTKHFVDTRGLFGECLRDE